MIAMVPGKLQHRRLQLTGTGRLAERVSGAEHCGRVCRNLFAIEI